MKVKNTPIDDLKPYAHNPKTHPAEQVEKIAASITEFGFLVPILIDADNYIIAGHGRLLAARKHGLVEVPTIRVDHLTEAQIRAYRIADNKLTESPWDIGELMVEIDDLKLGDYDIDLTGFGEIELGEVIKEKERHDARYKPGEGSITAGTDFIDDEKDALMADMEAQELFKNTSTILITFSGGLDSSFALYWAKTNFPEKEIVAVFADTGVELPGITGHIKACCDFMEVEYKIVKPIKDAWITIEERGFPHLIGRWCQQVWIYEPINKVYLEYDPNDVIIIDGSRADQVTRTTRKTKTSGSPESKMKAYQYYHPAFDVDKPVLEAILEKSGMPRWEGYDRGFVRTACWLCPGMCGDQALALSENYPGLTEAIRRLEHKLGTPLRADDNRSIDDMIRTGLTNRDRRNKQSLFEEMQ